MTLGKEKSTFGSIKDLANAGSIDLFFDYTIIYKISTPTSRVPTPTILLFPLNDWVINKIFDGGNFQEREFYFLDFSFLSVINLVT